MNNDLRNLVLTIFLSLAILFSWQYFFEQPRQAQISKAIEKQIKKAQPEDLLANQKKKEIELKKDDDKHILFKNNMISGFISTRGLRIAKLDLLKYRQAIDTSSPPVELLSSGSSPYFVEFGFLSKNANLEVPDINTIWSTNNHEFSPKSPAVFTWKNKQGIEFITEISVDENYLFTIRQTIKNKSGHKIEFNNYGRINRQYTPQDKALSVSFEGATGVFNDSLKEVGYSDLIEDGKITFNNTKKGWMALTEKYWMTAIFPDDRYSFTSNFNGYKKEGKDRYQVDFLSEDFEIDSGGERTFENFLYAGAKELELIDGYEKTENFALFDRSVDFGWFYFITKPIYLLLKFFYNYLGNYGLAIIAITLLIKIIMFPMANKSYKSMNRMKQLQPEVNRLKELYGSDQIKLNSEMMALYKRHKVSPLSGCLPLLIQIPVFFSLYKVIYISIDMRQAPFYGWIKDLSLPDPTSITNLFGLLPYEPFAIISIGVLPILMCLTMYIQQRLSPEPSDPVQAKVMKFLPLIFLFLFNGFPSGLLLYWTASNIISIIQQGILLKGSNEIK